MESLQIFKNETFGEVRTVIRDGEPWFVATDVCKALEIGTTSKALERLDDDEKGMSSIPTPGGEQNMSIINEAGLYSLVLGSRKPEAKPKVIFADGVCASKTSILIGDLAKLIRQNGVGVGQKRLFAWLRENGYLMKSGESYNMPTQRSMEAKWFEIKESSVLNPDGSIRVTKTPKVTGKGQVYFVNMFLAGNKA